MNTSRATANYYSAIGLFQGACANCHYGGSASRCSFRQGISSLSIPSKTMSNLVPSIQISKTRKHLIAENVPAPVIPGMAAANYTGGSLLHSNFQLEVVALDRDESHQLPLLSMASARRLFLGKHMPCL
jgi:hypothetical protein